jgi:hypothetical protein
MVRGVVELSDGRVIVSDWIEQRVLAIDSRFSAGSPIGKVGAGPEEYRLPAGLFRMAADSVLLVDVGNARLAVVSPRGRIARTIRVDRGGLGAPGGVDAKGRIYFAIPPWELERPDSLPVVRFDPATEATERIATVKGITLAGQGPRRTPGFPFVAFAPEDAWRVTPAGGLVIVRSGDYRVERVTPSGTTRGPSYAYRTEPVRQPDRIAFVKEFVSRAPTSGRGPDGSMGHTPPQSDAEIAAMAEANAFAELLPPFHPRHVALAPDGELWVARGRHAGAPLVYDRFDSSGNRVGQVRLAAHREVVALGRRYAYVAATDADGLQALERFVRPGV